MRLHIDSVGSGPPLIVMHGWAMHSGLWMPVLPKLAQRYRVHCVDLPGHGYSEAVFPYTLASVTGAVAAACEDLTVDSGEPLTLLGWSMGGAVAMHWAATRPDRVGALVLTCTTPCFVSRPDWSTALSEKTLRQFGDELSASYRLTLQRFVSLQVQGTEHARHVLAVLRNQLFSRGEPSPRVLSAALEMLIDTDLRSIVRNIHQPALVISGDRDTLAPFAAGQWLAASLPNATFAGITGAAHAPFLSHPDQFLAALSAFARPAGGECERGDVTRVDVR
jgi:pimeloyl-[acyl-carrier protein] methyl ester esterase